MNYKQKVGAFGEELARQYLIKNGYKIIDANVKLSYREIDIIAKYGEMFIFVEVKTRTSFAFGSADLGMNRKKTQNLKRALSNYAYKNKINANFLRLDLVSIDIDKESKIANIKHYKDIF